MCRFEYTDSSFPGAKKSSLPSATFGWNGTKASIKTFSFSFTRSDSTVAASILREVKVLQKVFASGSGRVSKLLTAFFYKARLDFQEMGRAKNLVFPPSVDRIYSWVEREVFGHPSVVTSEYLSHFREHNLISPEGEYEELYTLEVPDEHERICYINPGGGPNWMWMYDVLISKMGVRMPFTEFQFSVLERTRVAPTQLHPNSWAMIRGFEIVSWYLGVPPSSSAFFYLFTLTRPSRGNLATGWLSFRAHVNRKVFDLYEESFHNFKRVYFKVFAKPGDVPFWETAEGELRMNCYWCKDFDTPSTEEGDLTSEEKAVVDFILQCFGKKHLNLKGIVGVPDDAARKYLDEMAPKSAMAEFRRRLLRGPPGGGSSRLGSSADHPAPSDLPGPSIEPPLKKQKKGKAPSTGGDQPVVPRSPPPQRNSDWNVLSKGKAPTTGGDQPVVPRSPPPRRNSDWNVLSKDFPYADFVDTDVMSPRCWEQLRGDAGSTVEKFQWAGRMLLKSVALFRYGEEVVNSGARAMEEVKELEERLALLQAEKDDSEHRKNELASEVVRLRFEASEVDRLRSQLEEKDRRLENIEAELTHVRDASSSEINRLREEVAELTHIKDASSSEINHLREEVTRVEGLWKESAFEIKANLLEQAQVICPGADFSEVGLDKVVIDGRIVVAPDEDSDDGSDLPPQ